MRRTIIPLLIWVCFAMVSPALGLSGYGDKVLTIQPDDIVGYWAGEETGGAFALDSSGKNRHAYYYGTTLAASNAPDGSPVPSYDGISDLLDMPVDSVTGLNAADAWNWDAGAVSLWINHDSYIDPSYNGIFYISTATGYFVDAVEFLYNVNGGSSTVSVWMSRGGSSVNVATIMPDPGWHHWVWTWDASSVSLWLDGILVDTDAFGGSSTEAISTIRINCYNQPTYAARLGIWRDQLTGESIEALASWTGTDPYREIIDLGDRSGYFEIGANAGETAILFVQLVIAGLIVRGLHIYSKRR